MGCSHHVRCKKCNDVIQSTYRHDFKRCKCGSIFVDGGSDYLRIGWPEGNSEDWIEELRRYADWEQTLEKEEDCKVYDPDGLRAVINDDKEFKLMTKEEALDYFWFNTMKFGPKAVEKICKRYMEAER